MRVPLLLLAVPTTLGGLVVAYPGALLGPAHAEPLTNWRISGLMTALVAVTAAAVLWRWSGARGRDLWQSHALPHPPVDRVYDAVLVRPVRRLALVVRAGDRDVIDAYVDGAGAGTRGLGWLLRRAQNGNVQAYLMVVVVGATAIAVAAGALA